MRPAAHSSSRLRHVSSAAKVAMMPSRTSPTLIVLSKSMNTRCRAARLEPLIIGGGGPLLAVSGMPGSIREKREHARRHLAALLIGRDDVIGIVEINDFLPRRDHAIVDEL